MNTGQAMIIGPGQSAQGLHRDADNWPLVLGPNERPVTISCMFALTDFTAEAGATRVVPGSHRWDDFSRVPNPDEVVQAVMPAGSALIYSGRSSMVVARTQPQTYGAKVCTCPISWDG